jgi:hypothetical protein
MTLGYSRNAVREVTRNLTRAIALTVTLTLLWGCMWYPRSMDVRAAALRSEIADDRVILQGSAKPYFLRPSEAFAIAVSATPLRDVIEQYDRADQSVTLTYQAPHAVTFFFTSDVCKFMGIPYDFEAEAAAVTRIDVAMNFRLWNPAWDQDGFKFSASFHGSAFLAGTISMKDCASPFPNVADIPPGAYPLPLPPLVTAVADIRPGDDGDLRVYLTLLDPVTASVFAGAGLRIPALVPVYKISNPLKTVVPIKFLKDKPPLCFSVRFVADNVHNLPIGPRTSGTVSITEIPPDATGNACPGL